MTHPFLKLPPRLRNRLFIVFTGWSLLLTAVFQFLDQSLRTAAAPSGIVSFELARTVTNAKAILASWDASARVYAGLSLGLDALYPPLYATAIGLACAGVAIRLQRRGRPGLMVVGIWLTWGMAAAALFDYVENIVLVAQLLGSETVYFPTVAWAMASLKFTIIIVAFLYLIIGIFFVPSRKKQST